MPWHVEQSFEKNMRTGWWGVAAPFRNVSAVTANKVEARFLRSIAAPKGAKPAVPDPFVAAAAANAAAASTLRRSRTRRVMPWVTGFAAIAIAITVPAVAGGGSADQTPPAAPTSASATN